MKTEYVNVRDWEMTFYRGSILEMSMARSW